MCVSLNFYAFLHDEIDHLSYNYARLLCHRDIYYKLEKFFFLLKNVLDTGIAQKTQNIKCS